MPEMPIDPIDPETPPGEVSEVTRVDDVEDFLGLSEEYANPQSAPQPPESDAFSVPLDAEPPLAEADLELAAPEEQALASTDLEAESEPELEEGYDLDEEGEDSASWLMELDFDENEFSEDGASDTDEHELDADMAEPVGAAPSASAWVGRVLIALVSLGLGIAGSKFLSPAKETNNQSTPQQVSRGPVSVPAPVEGVVSVEESSTPAVGESSQGGPESAGTETSTSGGEALVESAPGVAGEGTSDPAMEASPASLTGRDPLQRFAQQGTRTSLTPVPPLLETVRGGTGVPLAPRTTSTETAPEVRVSQGPPTGVSQGFEPTLGGEVDPVGRERRTQEVPVEDMILVPDGLEGRIREATAHELAGVWMGSSLPLEAVASSKRILTPSVGRVRVHLAAGDIFEGNLYAVGQKKVWLETRVGKMALLDWQIDRIEHILTPQGTAALGEDGSQDLAGLARVRVRTPGGVFYGKLISQDGDIVSLITAEGGRLTLHDATVEPAGKSSTRIVDASGAQESPEDIE